ncbi:hypothetical protein APT59_14355 [Pseudomonas oryzihabitans]|uniref:Uncharacterized protein n=1 Tax=Pseudomonas oryzihabitans TaxID=47885 RepID=A0A0U4W6A8_9PSED|nr:hypothetical protein [Pseudomonas oryzihabitans]ALZ85318.1 hypothetical protein APT59_14355 [Pseudomonas oryzihabitans]
MLAYFVVSKSSGNIIRVTRRDVRPADSATVTFLEALPSELASYESAHARGQDLINIADTASHLSST